MGSWNNDEFMIWVQIFKRHALVLLKWAILELDNKLFVAVESN